jgi:Cdc6-like AAA superfamily ATPase
MWTIIIVGVFFFILRIAAASYPPAAAVFKIFEIIISWFMNALKMLAPKAHQISGMIEKKVFDGYKDTLVHIIDEIQLLKSKESNTTTKYTIDDLMEACSKSMDTEDKDRIEGIKRELHWK